MRIPLVTNILLFRALYQKLTRSLLQSTYHLVMPEVTARVLGLLIGASHCLHQAHSELTGSCDYTHLFICRDFYTMRLAVASDYFTWRLWNNFLSTFPELIRTTYMSIIISVCLSRAHTHAHTQEKPCRTWECIFQISSVQLTL